MFFICVFKLNWPFRFPLKDIGLFVLNPKGCYSSFDAQIVILSFPFSASYPAYLITCVTAHTKSCKSLSHRTLWSHYPVKLPHKDIKTQQRFSVSNRYNHAVSKAIGHKGKKLNRNPSQSHPAELMSLAHVETSANRCWIASETLRSDNWHCPGLKTVQLFSCRANAVPAPPIFQEPKQIDASVGPGSPVLLVVWRERRWV